EDVGARFEAYGWHVQHVDDGNDLAAIEAACEAAQQETSRPSLIVLRTVIGNPAPNKEGTAEAHGSPLGADEVRLTKQILGWDPDSKFLVPEEALTDCRHAIERGAALEAAWHDLRTRYTEAYPEAAAEFDAWLEGKLPDGWTNALPSFPIDKPIATRQASEKVLNALAPLMPNLIGGSADLAGSTGTQIKGAKNFEPEEVGRNFHWGVREHGMTAALNGMAAHGGVRPYGSTFLVFSDYAKPSLRLAAIQSLPIVFIGTHDSIGLGEDGPTHQPIEQMAMLRAMPNLMLMRPADAAETVEAWHAILEHKTGPVVLVLTRQKLPVFDRSRYAAAEGARRGAYILSEPEGGPQAILIATGSEVQVALAAADLLMKEGIRARVVSMPCWELFEQQPEAYRDQVLPPEITARVSIEAAATFGWRRWVGDAGAILGIDHFGASAPAARLFKEFQFTPEHAAELVRQVLEGAKS
ncbi:MAG TPA: transketolase, partial [Gemmatimonadales bacterium]|nr:transketolase [Gemmatimonadales bacterium]